MEAFSDIAARGRVLVQNLDASVVHDPPFLLACACEGAALDLAIRRVSLFAFTLSAIITTIVAIRAAPFPIIAIAITWFGGAATARLFAARRRRQHGHFVIDFEHESATRAGAAGEEAARIARGSVLEIAESMDAMAPYWLILRPSPARAWRIAKGTAQDLQRVVRLFREYHVEVRGKLDDERDR
jgi:hypothetical protein